MKYRPSIEAQLSIASIQDQVTRATGMPCIEVQFFDAPDKASLSSVAKEGLESEDCQCFIGGRFYGEDAVVVGSREDAQWFLTLFTVQDGIQLCPFKSDESWICEPNEDPVEDSKELVMYFAMRLPPYEKFHDLLGGKTRGRASCFLTKRETYDPN